MDHVLLAKCSMPKDTEKYPGAHILREVQSLSCLTSKCTIMVGFDHDLELLDHGGKDNGNNVMTKFIINKRTDS